MVCGPGDAAAPTGDQDQAGRSGRAQFPASLLRDLTGRSALVFLGWLARPEAIDLSEGRRDRDHLVMTLRIGFPSRDGALRDKDVNPQPRDEMETHSLRAVHVVPRDLHLVHPMMRPSSSPTPRKAPSPVCTGRERALGYLHACRP
jgi:hypothetical protein